MFRACLAFVFAIVFSAATGFSQTKTEKSSPAPSDTSKSVPATAASVPAVAAADSVPAPTVEPATPASLETKASEPKREPQDLRLFNDPPLIAKEYGFGILGSIVAGALGFYIGSGIETAIEGESQAHQGTLGFTGIRYDNFYGAWYGGATGMVMGSALTSYFVGQTDEEDGGLLLTLAGTAAAAGGAFYIAHLMGVNDEIDWKPFIPLLAIPSLGGTFGFNVSRLFSDHSREKTVGGQTSIWMHPPRLAWGRDAGGDRFEFRALNLTF
jgi:hypothetical protein